MDYSTARDLLQSQGSPTEDPNAFLMRLKQGKPPVPGQVTTLLLALKVLYERLGGAEFLDRELVHALYVLAIESRYYYDSGRQQGVNWPPLLDEDLMRIAIAVKSIFSGTWEGS
ncbi:Dethiobiotin synthetase [Leptolyngbya sp. AN02str]|uniref:Dethiobiotin synthetase n=1 Tax=Leptolyngbya sp. AN02str TaxID=3423363 RepID=UPI003D312849